MSVARATSTIDSALPQVGTARPEGTAPTAIDALARQLNALCDAQPFHTGWYLKDFRTGEAADRHGHVVVPSASTRKIAILMAALKAVGEGALALDQPVTIQAKYQRNTSGCFQHLRPGFTLTLRDVLVMMIIVSDNTCTGTVADMVGLEAVNRLCRAIGMRGTTHRHGIPPEGGPQGVEHTNATTPADVGLLLDLILHGSDAPAAPPLPAGSQAGVPGPATGPRGGTGVPRPATGPRAWGGPRGRDQAGLGALGCTPELCRLALDILSWQKLRARLPFLLPTGTKVAHKTGTGARCFNDAGIVFEGDRPLFILTVYTNEVPPELPDGTPGAAAAAQLIARLARTCWDSLATSPPRRAAPA